MVSRWPSSLNLRPPRPERGGPNFKPTIPASDCGMIRSDLRLNVASSVVPWWFLLRTGDHRHQADRQNHSVFRFVMARSESVTPRNFARKSNGLEAPLRVVLDEMLDALLDVLIGATMFHDSRRTPVSRCGLVDGSQGRDKTGQHDPTSRESKPESADEA
jgi:hypothetical protein